MKSAALHALPILSVLVPYALGLFQPKPPQRVFELVAGAGDNFAATAAPALGEPGGIKVAAPEQPVAAPPEPPKQRPVAPPPEPPPVTKAPPKATPKPAEPKLDFAKDIKQAVKRADTKTKREIEKERAAEAKRLTKEEFDRQNKAKAKSTNAPTQVAKAKGEGIKTGVPGGSTANKTGGAGGKALVRDDGPVMDAYFSLLKSRL